MFDFTSRDSQATPVEPVDIDGFDFDRYTEYAEAQDRKVEAFMNSDSGVLVYRRFRVAEVFSYGCRDMKRSLRCQLGGLKMSLDYKADMANYLEPWYGFGTVSAAYGSDYVWKDGQSPVAPAVFEDVEAALAYDPKPIHETGIGRHQLDFIEYFMDVTRGRLPVSFGDSQSSIDAISELMPISEMFMDMYDDGEAYTELAFRVGGLMKDFNEKQRVLLGSAAAYPGHGFASSRVTKGFGVSGDTAIMMNNAMFDELVAPQMADMCVPFGGAYFHSCGNWEVKIPSVLKIGNILGADAAFGSQTDPSPNSPAVFGEAFAGTGKILNLRVVGDSDTVIETVRSAWRPGLRLIVNTYCKTPDDQTRAYDAVHEICQS